MVQLHKKCIHQNHLRLRNSLYHLARKRKHCQRNVYLACVLSLLLLLAGDVELNPGPYHNNEISSLPASAAKLTDDQSKKRAESEARRSSRLSMLSIYQRKCLENETGKEYSAGLAKMSENQRLHLQCETEQQRSVRLSKYSENQKKRLKSESAEQREARVATLSENQKKHLKSESAEQREARVATLSENQKKQLKSQSAEQHEARVATLRENQKKCLKSQSIEERQARLATLSVNRKQRLLSETDENLESTLSGMKEWKKSRSIKESEQERTLRLKREKDQARLGMQVFRKRKQELFTNHESLDEYHGVQKTENIQCVSVTSQVNLAVGDIDSLSKERLQGEQILLCNHAVLYGAARQDCTYQMSEEKDMEEDVEVTAISVSESVVTVPTLQIALPSNQGKKLRNNLQKFEKVILEGPTHKCYSCGKLCYRHLGATFSLDVAVELLSTINKSIQDNIKTVWFCNRCKSLLQRNKIPAVSQFNKMKVVDIPSVLMGLNTLEQRSKATVFMKMVILPRGGQRAVRGQVIKLSFKC